MSKDELNSRIDEAIKALRAIKKWINDPEQDEKAKANTWFWLGELLSKVYQIATELR